ncbi:MAG: hypothetical protein J5612_03200, partial [Paludibacteraceae bacterium]|nr:hypothetical protein [Paludibacteraceae bacterium]
SHDLVQDEVIHGEYGGSFAAGVEYRIGQKRVQGVFGAGLVYAFQTFANKYSYGNEITEMNQIPTVAADLVAAGVWNNMEPGVYADTRIINDAASPANPAGGLDDAFYHRIGLYTTVGVEWFVAPKIALGLNVNLDLLYRWSNNVCRQYEGYNTLTGKVETFTDKRGLSNYNGVHFGTENIGANLYMHFFF